MNLLLQKNDAAAERKHKKRGEGDEEVAASFVSGDRNSMSEK